MFFGDDIGMVFDDSSDFVNGVEMGHPAASGVFDNGKSPLKLDFGVIECLKLAFFGVHDVFLCEGFFNRRFWECG